MFVMQSKKLSDKLYDRVIAQDFAHNYIVTLTYVYYTPVLAL